MSEVPRLPDNSGGDDDRKWSMDPNAGKNELAVVDQGGDGAEQPTESTELSTEVNPAGSTESSTEVNPAEVDNTTAEGSEDAESAEAKEAERLHKEIAQNYTSDIFKAARKIEKPVSNAMDVFDWSLEDQQRLLDALKNAGNEPESNDSETSMNSSDAEQGLEGSTADQQNQSNAASEAPVETASHNPDANSSDSGENDDSNAAAAAAAAAAGVAAGVAAERANGAGGEEEEIDESELAEEVNRIENSNQPESEKKNERKKTLKRLAKRGIIVALALATVLGLGSSGKKGKQEVKDNTTPIAQEIEDDQEENESIHDRSTYHGMFASEDGSTYNSEKLGKRNFGESLGSNLSEDEMRQELGDRMIQPGQLAATYYYMQEKTADPNFGVDGARFDNPDDLLEAMEADGDLHQRVYDYVMSIFENGSFTENSVTGTFHNFFMDSEFETGDSDTSNIEVVGCTTQEDGTKVYTVRRVWIDENKNEHTDIFTFKVHCGGQPLDEFDFTTTVRQVPPEDEDTPPDDKETPPEDHSKTPFDQDKVEEGLDGLVVDQQDQNGTVSDKPAETANYDANENNDGSDGAEHNEKAPDSNEQVGAQDTNEQSADGSGRTVAEVVEEAEDNGGAGGENTSNQVNRTAEDQAQHDADEAGAAAQQQANENEDRSAGQASETMTDEEAADAFANGDF